MLKKWLGITKLEDEVLDLREQVFEVRNIAKILDTDLPALVERIEGIQSLVKELAADTPNTDVLEKVAGQTSKIQEELDGLKEANEYINKAIFDINQKLNKKPTATKK